MYISLKAATTSDAGVMSAQDKTSLDNLSNKLVVLEQLNGNNIILKSIGGKTKDSEMRAIIDANTTDSLRMPGIITLKENNIHNTLWCMCRISLDSGPATGTMVDMIISIAIDATDSLASYTESRRILYQTIVTSISPCTLKIEDKDSKSTTYDVNNCYKKLPYIMQDTAVKTYTEANHIYSKAIYAPGIPFIVKPTFLGSGTNVIAMGMISVVNISSSADKLMIMPSTVIRLVNNTTTAQTLNPRTFGISIPVALDTSVHYITNTILSTLNKSSQSVVKSSAATISVSGSKTAIVYGSQCTIPANGELLTFISPSD